MKPFVFLPIFLVMTIFSSCKDDDPIVVPPDNGGDDLAASMNMFCYNINDYRESFCIRTLSPGVGPALQCAAEGQGYLNHWTNVAGIKLGKKQYMFFQNNLNDHGHYIIMDVLANGQLGDKTDEGYGEINNDTFTGFYVGDKGYFFGQDGSSHDWNVYEINSQGKLGRQTVSGSWHYYYQAVTPIYANGNTYLFFQTDKNDHYWFITHVSSNGELTDVCDGSWGNLWNPVTSVTVNGKAYLIGERKKAIDPIGQVIEGEWFIQRINDDGTMGVETDRNTWNSYYHILTGFSYGSKSYIFGHNDSNGYWFVQEITEDGKMGAEVSNGNLDKDDSYFFPISIYDPGNFRYVVGWDLWNSDINPNNGWSSSVQLPWSGETKLSGGAAVDHIDNDAANRYDALLSGIQSLPGADRFYYKIAWNLDIKSAQPTSWSQTFYGPSCGELQAGGGAAISWIDDNKIPDLVLMSVDDPAGPNSFWYYIGWNLDATGQVASWSDKYQINGLGDFCAGGGVAIGDIDLNGKPDMVLMAIDDPAGSNHFRYTIGMNLDHTGKATSWTPIIEAPVALGDFSAGGGVALTDLNHNMKSELILMNLDASAGPNHFWGYIGWDIDSTGIPTHWTGPYWNTVGGPQSLGNITSGGGLAIRDINGNTRPDILLMTIDNPFGKD